MKVKNLVISFAYRPDSLWGLLRRELGRKRAAELKKYAARELVSEAARILDLSEIDFLKRVASSLGLPLVERLDSVDLSRLPWKFRLSELRRLGALPVIQDYAIAGFVVNNPDPLLDSPNFSGYPLALAPLALIECALDESEAGYRMRTKIDPIRDELSLSVLKTLIESCQEHGAEALQISFGERPSYAFTTMSGKRAEGYISHVAVDGVRRILGSLVFKSLSELEAQTKISELSCQSDPNRGEFYLRWSSANKFNGRSAESRAA